MVVVSRSMHESPTGLQRQRLLEADMSDCAVAPVPAGPPRAAAMPVSFEQTLTLSDADTSGSRACNRRYARQRESRPPSAEAHRTGRYVALRAWPREIRGRIASAVIIAMAFAQVRRTLEPRSAPDS